MGAGYGGGGCSNSTRGLIHGPISGAGNNETIQYITIAATGNTTDFGDLTAVASYCSACASSIRGVMTLGMSSGSYSNVLNYVTISSTGNAQDFGDLTVARDALGATSSAHGGL